MHSMLSEMPWVWRDVNTFVTFILLPIFSSRGAVEVGFPLVCIAFYRVELLTLFYITIASLPS
jgi:hypothetical protein